MASIPGSNYKFERIEKKFWMTAEQYTALLPALEKHLQHDRYGISTICNIYYDTPDYTLIRRSIERPLFKEKLRLRSYGIPGESDKVYVEIKRKLNGIGYKRRISIPFVQAKKLLQGERIFCGNRQIEEEILNFVERYHPQPMVFLTYRRYAMTAPEDPGFRVTIDRQLRYRMCQEEAMADETAEKLHKEIQPITADTDAAEVLQKEMLPIMASDSDVLMEIKALGAIPRWLTDEMNRLGIRQAPFSKIGTCYSRHIAPITMYGRPAYRSDLR